MASKRCGPPDGVTGVPFVGDQRLIVQVVHSDRRSEYPGGDDIEMTLPDSDRTADSWRVVAE
jgi:hypothetical protein